MQPLKKRTLKTQHNNLRAIAPQVYYVSNPGSIPTKDLCYIYTVRAKINQEKQGTIEGYETLIPVLTNTFEEELRLYEVSAPEEWFLIFTDPTTTRWIGMLSNKSDRAYQYHRQHSVSED